MARWEVYYRTGSGQEGVDAIQALDIGKAMGIMLQYWGKEVEKLVQVDIRRIEERR